MMIDSRIRSLDAGRGLAMLFVFLSHFVEYYLTCHGKISQLHAIWSITMIASPTFMLISGITLGYLFSVKQSNFALTQRKFMDRGLFLLSVAHILIMISWIPMLMYYHSSVYRVLFITDTIGICLIAGPLIIPVFKPGNRLILSLGLYILSWLIIALTNLKNIELIIIQDTVFGAIHNSKFTDNFPILPWLSIYLLGTIIGEKIGFYHLNGFPGKITSLFFKIGVLSVSFSGIIIICHKILKAYSNIGFNNFLTAFISGSQKNPPGLVYFLFYSGAGLILLGTLNKMAESGHFDWIIAFLEIIGKTSLFAFIIQYFMYFSFVIWINPPYSDFWPVFFLLTLFMNIIAIRLWYRSGLNRFLTLLDFPVWRAVFGWKHHK
jgi:hypothetical protein